MANTAENAWHRLTMASEDYLETIYRIMQEENAFEGIRSKDVADQLEVSKASVNKALNVLKENGYVEQNRYGRIQLTNTGREYAAHIWRCHRMIRSFLVQDLGVTSEIADNEACLMEHAISTDTQNRWLAYLDKQGITIEEQQKNIGIEAFRGLQYFCLFCATVLNRYTVSINFYAYRFFYAN